MAEGRRIKGEDFVENMQDYVEERMTEGTDVDELSADARALRQQAADLQHLQQGGATTPTSPDQDALAKEAQIPSGRMDVRPDPADLSIDATVDPRQQPPQAEARERMIDDVNDAAGQGNIRR